MFRTWRYFFTAEYSKVEIRCLKILSFPGVLREYVPLRTTPALSELLHRRFHGLASALEAVEERHELKLRVRTSVLGIKLPGNFICRQQFPSEHFGQRQAQSTKALRWFIALEDKLGADQFRVRGKVEIEIIRTARVMKRPQQRGGFFLLRQRWPEHDHRISVGTMFERSERNTFAHRFENSGLMIFLLWLEALRISRVLARLQQRFEVIRVGIL